MAEARKDPTPRQLTSPSKVSQRPSNDSHRDFWKCGSIPESRDGTGRKPKARRLRPHGKLNHPNFAELGRPYRWWKDQPRPTQMVEYGPQRVYQAEPDEARVAEMAALAAKELAGELSLDLEQRGHRRAGRGPQEILERPRAGQVVENNMRTKRRGGAAGRMSNMQKALEPQGEVRWLRTAIRTAIRAAGRR